MKPAKMTSAKRDALQLAAALYSNAIHDEDLRWLQSKAGKDVAFMLGTSAFRQIGEVCPRGKKIRLPDRPAARKRVLLNPNVAQIRETNQAIMHCDQVPQAGGVFCAEHRKSTPYYVDDLAIHHLELSKRQVFAERRAA